MIDLAKRVNVLTGMLERIDDKSRRSLVVAEIAVCDRILAAARDGGARQSTIGLNLSAYTRRARRIFYGR